jgi:hypothetical protein
MIKNTLKTKTVSVTVITQIVGILLVVLCSVPIDSKNSFGQADSTPTSLPVSNETGLIETGMQLMLLTESGGIAPIDKMYTFNRATNDLVTVDLANNTVIKKTLNSSEIQELGDAIYSFPINMDVNDRKPCPDCIQYGLTYFFLDFEKAVPFKEAAFWTSATPGTEGNTEFAGLIEEIASR